MWKAIVWKSQYDSKRLGQKTQAAGTQVITIERAIRKASPSGETSFMVRHGLRRKCFDKISNVESDFEGKKNKSLRDDTKKKGPGWN